MKLTLGTRGSELARTQSGHVADALRAARPRGRAGDDPLRGRRHRRFAAGRRRPGGVRGRPALALLEGEVDLVVHSLKDLPTAPVPGSPSARSPSASCRFDVLCARDGLTLADLPPMARVGTGSPRRAASCARGVRT